MIVHGAHIIIIRVHDCTDTGIPKCAHGCTACTQTGNQENLAPPVELHDGHMLEHHTTRR